MTACSGNDDTAPCNCTDGDTDTDADSDSDTDTDAGDTDVVDGADWSDAPTFVLRSSPASGEVVDPDTSQISVTFSVPMFQGNYSWVTMDDVTQVDGSNPHWDDDRTAVIDVSLEANTTYGVWVNRYPEYTAFESVAGVEALPFALVFKTAPE
jgi:hypothetical protein